MKTFIVVLLKFCVFGCVGVGSETVAFDAAFKRFNYGVR